MISIARKNLFKDKVKLSITVGGIALAMLMVLALIGVYFGVSKAARNVPLTAGADYWVIQKSAQSQANSASILVAHKEEQLRQIEGVSQAVPVLAGTTSVVSGDQEVTAVVVGYDTTTGIGLSGRLFSGDKEIESGEVLVDRALAAKSNLKLGSPLVIGNRTFKVVGMLEGTNRMDLQFVFIPFEDAVSAFEQSEAVTYYLINSTLPLDDLRQRVEAVVPGSKVETKEALADGNAKTVKNTLGVIIQLLVVVGLIVSTAITGLTIYAATIDHAKEYAILKALGVSNRRLYGIVFQQTFLATTIGFIAGLILYFAVRLMAFYAAPGVVMSIPWPYYLLTFALASLAGLMSLIIPVRKISTIDPVEVFNR